MRLTLLQVWRARSSRPSLPRRPSRQVLTTINDRSACSRECRHTFSSCTIGVPRDGTGLERPISQNGFHHASSSLPCGSEYNNNWLAHFWMGIGCGCWSSSMGGRPPLYESEKNSDARGASHVTIKESADCGQSASVSESC
jgi:hypothetical protein